MGKKQNRAAIKPAKIKATKPQKTSAAPEPADGYDARESLMPELEALVKKNPNRLIGCGG